MAELELGRVQGASIFYSITEPDDDNHIYIRNLRLADEFTPQLKDLVITPNSDLRHIIGVGTDYVVVGQVCGSIKGEKGDTGNGLTIKEHFNSFSDVPDPSEEWYGDCIIVGEIYPYDIYVCTMVDGELTWVNMGHIQGPQGEKGSTGEIYIEDVVTVPNKSNGEVGDAYVNNNGTSTEARLVFGIPQGIQGEPGQDGKDGERGPVGYVRLEVIDGMLRCTTNDDIRFSLDGNGNLVINV